MQLENRQIQLREAQSASTRSQAEVGGKVHELQLEITGLQQKLKERDKKVATLEDELAAGHQQAEHLQGLLRDRKDKVSRPWVERSSNAWV